ncbi:sulfotransferase [Mucilaginibacter sp. AW1-7]|uniref:sulfotransferase n=1 Tax=Mucilaginibacter sp. AW1-7 TaxID=3349874 RepID=UPI003F73956E
MQKRTLIITGMHRSGTSLITHWLAKCGMQLGEKMVEPGPGNAEGHFEDVEFLKIHEEILTNHNLPRNGLTDGYVDAVSIYEKEKIKSIIKVKQQLYYQWGWKDPRTCMFLDVYKELIPDARYLVIMRDYRSVTSSLLRREFKTVDRKYLGRKYLSRLVWLIFRRARRKQSFYRINAEAYLKVWINYTSDILACIKKLDPDAFVVVNYNMLSEEDTRVFGHLQNKWNFSLTYSKFKDVFKENLIGQDIDIDPYITNKALLNQAKQLQDELMGYMSL